MKIPSIECSEMEVEVDRNVGIVEVMFPETRYDCRVSDQQSGEVRTKGLDLGFTAVQRYVRVA